MVLPIITFPIVLLTSYSNLLIPEYSTYLAQNNFKAINFISNKIFKITCPFAICISSIFFIFSNDLGIIIYNNPETSYFFKILSPLIFFIYMDNILDSILKGLNKQFGVMCCNIIDLSITTLIVFFLLPLLGLKGYIFSIFASELINFTISFLQMIKYSKIKINIKDWILIPSFCCLSSYFFIKPYNLNFTNLILNLICKITIFILIYISVFIITTFLLNKHNKSIPNS